LKLKQLQEDWDANGRRDAMWAILTDPAKRAQGWREDEFFATGAAEIERLADAMAGLNLPLTGARALDFGCGVGRLTQALASFFNEVHGVDIAASMIERAAQLNPLGPRCVYHLNAANNLALFETGYFNFVYCSIVLQHMPAMLSEPYLREFVRVLAPGGILVVQIPARHRAPLRHRAHTMCLGIALSLARMLHYRPRPIMLMHGSEPSRVRCVLEGAGATVVCVQPNDDTGPDWEGYRYFAQKLRR